MRGGGGIETSSAALAKVLERVLGQVSHRSFRFREYYPPGSCARTEDGKPSDEAKSFASRSEATFATGKLDSPSGVLRFWQDPLPHPRWNPRCPKRKASPPQSSLVSSGFNWTHPLAKLPGGQPSFPMAEEAPGAASQASPPTDQAPRPTDQASRVTNQASQPAGGASGTQIGACFRRDLGSRSPTPASPCSTRPASSTPRPRPGTRPRRYPSPGPAVGPTLSMCDRSPARSTRPRIARTVASWRSERRDPFRAPSAGRTPRVSAGSCGDRLPR